MISGMAPPQPVGIDHRHAPCQHPVRLKLLDAFPAGGLRQAGLLGDLGDGHRCIPHQFGKYLAVDQVKMGHVQRPFRPGLRAFGETCRKNA